MNRAVRLTILSLCMLLTATATVFLSPPSHAQRPWLVESPKNELAVPPLHQIISLKKNVRWQRMPDAVLGVYVEPDQRVWTELRSDQPLSEGCFKAMIEREYANSDPQFSGAALLLFEPVGAGSKPAKGFRHYRVWFGLIHVADRWIREDQTWGVLLGYDGTPGQWLEQKSIGEIWSPGGQHILWEDGVGRYEPARRSLFLDGRAFFVHGTNVDCFDGDKWTSQAVRTYEELQNNQSIDLMPEPDGKGIVVTVAEQYNADNAKLWHASSREVWRWRDGAWKKIMLPVPVHYTEFDTSPILGDGGMWNFAREGIWFSAFEGATNRPIPKFAVGPYQFREPFSAYEANEGYFPRLFETDEKGRLYVGADLIWESDKTTGPNPAVAPLVDQFRAMVNGPNRDPSRARELEGEILKMGGGVIVREPGGSCHLLSGVMHRPRALQDQLPDQSFRVIDSLNSGVIFARLAQAGWDGSGRSPIMVYTPGASTKATYQTSTDGDSETTQLPTTTP